MTYFHYSGKQFIFLVDFVLLINSKLSSKLLYILTAIQSFDVLINKIK